MPNKDIMPLIKEIKENINNQFSDLKLHNTKEHSTLQKGINSLNTTVSKHEKFIIKVKVILTIFGGILAYLVLPILKEILLKLLKLT